MLGPPIDGLDRRPIPGSASMVMEVRLREGFVVPRHNHPEEQFSYMISGHLQFWTDDEPEGFIVGPGDLVHFPPNAWHRALALDDVVEIDFFCPIRPQLLGPLITASGDPA
ncbi:cupin domain-containing protein [Sphingomonas profundi]|uniref:cupin domain-containing protein n=1 Tax=Alterirhizorhabdus profundi TaxID=2681549 RepID=UPI0018D0D0FD|nr:cupin domain-containing protein [Sphingomonas profundi]